MSSDTTGEIETSRNAINHFNKILSESSDSIRVSDKENPALFPLFEHIRFNFAKYWTGIVVVDRQGIYTPIEKYDNNIIHLMRLPKLNVPVYGLSDLRSIVHTKCEGLTVVFQGVYKTVTGSYDFISREYYIRPVPGISFEKHLIVQHVVKIGMYEPPINDDSDEDDYDDLE